MLEETREGLTGVVHEPAWWIRGNGALAGGTAGTEALRQRVGDRQV